MNEQNPVEDGPTLVGPTHKNEIVEARPNADFFTPGRMPTASFPYKIEKQIGSGAMGIVFKATDSTLERSVAIKILRRSVLEEAALDEREQMRRRFLQEARAAAALAHLGSPRFIRLVKKAISPTW